MSNYLITQGSVVNEGQIDVLDIRIQGQRILEIGKHLKARANERVIDAHNQWVMPGMIDDQVHFREPGLMHKGEIATESAAAVVGGITSYMEMPNTLPVTATEADLLEKIHRAQGKSLANFAFYLGATNKNLGDIQRLNPRLACGIKVFMGSSTGDLVVDSDAALEGIFRDAPIVVVTHCEDDGTIRRNLIRYQEAYGDTIPMIEHPMIRSRESCLLSSQKAIGLAKRFGTQLHILHLTTEHELALFDKGSVGSKNITAEVCVHHLWFSEKDYTRLGALIKCNPSIKQERDRGALLKAVQEDQIDIIATDHAPHTWDEKHQLYTKAPSGLPLVQHALLMLLEFYHQGLFSLEKIVQKTSHAVAQRFQIQDRGFIREGYFADLVIVDPQNAQTVKKQDLLYKCAWSPLEGTQFQSKIVMTFVNGHPVYQDGMLDRSRLGMALAFDR